MTRKNRNAERLALTLTRKQLQAVSQALDQALCGDEMDDEATFGPKSNGLAAAARKADEKIGSLLYRIPVEEPRE